MTIAAALTSVNTALTIAKAMRQVEKDYDAAVLKGQIADLMVAVAEAKIALVDAQDQISEKEDEVRRLKDALKSKAELIEVDGYMFATSPDGRPKGLPFCSACLVSDGTQIRPARSINNMFTCPRCKANYRGLPDYR